MSDWASVRKLRLTGFPTGPLTAYADQKAVSFVLAQWGNLSVHHHETSKSWHGGRKQCETATALTTQCDLPQSHQLLPLRVGDGDLCRFPLRRQHRQGQWHV